MKTKFYLLMAALPLLAACSSDEVTSVSQTPITLRVNTQNVTRVTDGSIYGSDNMPAFKLWAVKGSEVYINGDKLSVGSGVLTTEYYWPFDGSSLDFYAVAGSLSFDPSNASSAISYTVDSDVSKHEDLMYAMKKDQSQAGRYEEAESSSNAGDRAVPLNFRHALSQVAFEIENRSSKLWITVNSITLGNYYSQAEFNFPTADTDTESTTQAGNDDGVGTTWSETGSRCSWDNHSGTIDFTIKPDKEQGDDVNTDPTVELDPSKSYSFNERMLIIPYENDSTTKWTPSETGGTYIAVNCTIVHKEESTTRSDETTYNELQEYTGKVIFPKAFRFIQGFKYTFRFVFKDTDNEVYDENGNRILVPLELKLSSDGWENATNTTDSNLE